MYTRELGISHLRKKSNGFSKEKKVLQTLRTEECRNFSAYDFFTKKNLSGDLHMTKSFEHILFENMDTLSCPWTTLCYCDEIKNDGKDHKILRERNIAPLPAIHTLFRVAHLLSDTDRTKKYLLASGNKKIATNIFYARNRDSSLAVIGARWNRVKNGWHLFGWRLGERDMHSDTCRIFF